MLKEKTKAIEGFSRRFNELLDMAKSPTRGRITWGAEKFGVRPNTFSNWLQKDEPPRLYNTLIEVSRILLEDIPGDYDAKAVAAWLQNGASVPNPFEEYDIDFVAKGDIYLLLMEMANQRDLNLDADSAREITFKVYNYVMEQESNGEQMRPIRENECIQKILSSKLDLITYGIE